MFIILLIISVTLIIVIYMQSGWAKNISSSIIGNQSLELFENTKARGSEKVLMIATGVLIFLFILITILIRVL